MNAECGKCYCIRAYLGYKQDCPDPHEGFYNDDDIVPLCSECEKENDAKDPYP